MDNNKIIYTPEYENTETEAYINKTLFECRNLTKNFGGTHALKGINLKLEKGKIIGLLGPNGSGKSTLIKLANGLLTPTSGELLINGFKPGPETKKIVSYLLH